MLVALGRCQPEKAGQQAIWADWTADWLDGRTNDLTKGTAMVPHYYLPQLPTTPVPKTKKKKKRKSMPVAAG